MSSDGDATADCAGTRTDGPVRVPEALDELTPTREATGGGAAQAVTGFAQQAWSMGSSLDLRNLAELLELAEGSERR